MITVEVVSISGLPPPHPMSAQIDELGGTLGRSPDCTLVLLDEKRAVSRIHGQVSFNAGQYKIEDQGTNPLKVNGVPVGKGNSAVIKGGDRIVIGPYELQVQGAAPAPRAAPPMSASQQAWASPAAPAPAPASFAPPAAPKPAPASSSSNPFDDLFGPGAGSGAPDAGSASSSPFADLGFGDGAASAPPSPSTSRTSSPASNPFSSAGLPDDFDPMAPPPGSHDDMLPPAGADLPDDAFGALMSTPAEPGAGSLDALFGLSSGPSSSADPFSSGPLGKPPPSHAGGTDSGLTQWIGGMNKAPVAAPTADQVPELNSAYQPPRGYTPSPAAPAASAAPPELPDFDFGEPEPAPPPKAEVPRPAPAAAPVPPLRPVTRPVPPAGSPSLLPAAPPRPRPSGPGTPASELLDAFMSGLNAQDLVIDELTPELMHKIGALMHEATSGTLALLSARGTVKREMRADVTMIASGRNNPLKFSPDARLALRYLFGPAMPGFMEADEAMRDAYNDLRAHEFGFMAGLRAALGGVLKRFEPEQLEARLPEKGGFNALVPMNRKAKLWEMFSELYRQLTVEAEEDFHALFGREFLRAYEEHVAAMEKGQPGRRK